MALHRQFNNVQDVATFMTLDAIKMFKRKASNSGFRTSFDETADIDKMFSYFLKESMFDSDSLLKTDEHDWNAVTEMWMNFLQEHEVFTYKNR